VSQAMAWLYCEHFSCILVVFTSAHACKIGHIPE
jgi:hypothetical protein